MRQKNIKQQFANYVIPRGYLSTATLNLIIYGVIYKVFGFEWAVILALSMINSDQDWTNILLFKNKKL